MTLPRTLKGSAVRGGNRRRPRARAAVVAGAALGAGAAGIAGVRLALGRGRATAGGSAAGEGGGQGRANHPDETFPSTQPNASAILTDAEPTDAVSPLRFAEKRTGSDEESAPLATEDAPTTPDEGLVANSNFANEIRNDSPAHPASI
jgi:hypothetical protein